MSEDTGKPILPYATPVRRPPVPWDAIVNRLVTLVFILGIVVILLIWLAPSINGKRVPLFIHAGIQMKSLMQALDKFSGDCGRYPTSAEGLNALLQAPQGAPNWQGPYIDKKSFIDPWGNRYSYTRSPIHEYLLETRGSNGLAGDSDDQVGTQDAVVYRENLTGPDGLLGTSDDRAVR